MRLSDSIENFIKELLTDEEPQVELKRNELAEYFGCAPSQINYVLATRFSPSQGYMTESHRGGGGYIRIVRVIAPTGLQLLSYFENQIGDQLDEQTAQRLAASMQERGLVDERQAAMMRAAVSSRSLSVPMPEAMKDALRARIFKSMLAELARHA